MAKHRAAPPPVSQELREYLAAAAQQELDALRAEFDERLAALEAALARRDPRASLEQVILDLARVATSEAEAAARRATIEAQRHAEQQSAAPESELQRALDAEHSVVKGLRAELDSVRARLDAEREGVARLREEVDPLRKALDQQRRAAEDTAKKLERTNASSQTAAEGAAAGKRRIDELTHTVERERARAAALDSELKLQRAAVEERSNAIADLEKQLGALRKEA